MLVEEFKKLVKGKNFDPSDPKMSKQLREFLSRLQMNKILDKLSHNLHLVKFCASVLGDRRKKLGDLHIPANIAQRLNELNAFSQSI